MEKYIRVKVSQGDLTSSQLIPEDQLSQWLKTHSVEGYLRDGYSISFSVAKKSSIMKLK